MTLTRGGHPGYDDYSPALSQETENMVAELMNRVGPHVSSLWHLTVSPSGNVGHWRVQARNRYWLAVVSTVAQGKFKLTSLYVSGSRSAVYSSMINHRPLPDQQLYIVGMAWYSDVSVLSQSPEDLETPVQCVTDIVAELGQDIHDAYCHSIKAIADEQLGGVATIPILGTIK